MKVADLRKAKKKRLLTLLLKVLGQNKRLKETVGRLTRLSGQPPVIRHPSHEDDFVPAGWTERHGIEIPRADGVFDSGTAWVRIKYGVIVGAGLKNQSILSLAISLDLLDQGAEHHANLYRDWRAAFLSRLDPSRSGDEGSDNPDAWSKEDRYSKLIHRIGKEYLDAMDCIVASRPKAKQLAAFQAKQDGFVGAFKVVAKAMVEINQEAEQAQTA
ncbi:hypothetical protein OJF2_51050 [Aquisphaera giovannonii]|uniref:Uncharacterized protein n=1 Tax=Aquisphaera giovannonii TaxID=406548 RepID=A0A5B9W919_9BACT|nr:hypothetical protein [Aquisphaera giovannonii]QEH36521.1 hypothetical protein OJF2_51050 [Aquisphaera giovannonii]